MRTGTLTLTVHQHGLDFFITRAGGLETSAYLPWLARKGLGRTILN